MLGSWNRERLLSTLPETDTAELQLPEPVKRYRRVVDRLECPICGKRLGEKWWDHRIRNWSMIAYQDSGPTYYRDEVTGPKVRTFKPCGCQVEATDAAA